MSEISTLAESFKHCRKILIALGDENRQHLMLEMMRMEKCRGARVGEITERTNLSRPAVSHHLQILKEAGVITMQRDGTKNYYSFDSESHAIDDLINMLLQAKNIMKEI